MATKKVKDSQTIEDAIEAGDLGSFLRLAREKTGLSQGDVAKKLKMTQFQSISQWERNARGSVPIRTLLKLTEIYNLKIDIVYDVLLKFQQKRVEEKLEKKFFGKSKKASRSA
jgi:transcriptional regulator with XRE-family HTH domain